MNKIFFKSGQWFAFNDSTYRAPDKGVPGARKWNKEREQYLVDKANALPILNQEICPQNVSAVEEGKEYDWPGTMKMELTEGWVPSYNDPDNSGWHSPAEPKGYILSLPETTASGDTASPPIWYTENEMYQWLIRENYSEQIAKELSNKWADHLQGAFNKGFEKGARYREQVGGDTAKQGEKEHE